MNYALHVGSHSIFAWPCQNWALWIRPGWFWLRFHSCPLRLFCLSFPSSWNKVFIGYVNHLNRLKYTQISHYLYTVVLGQFIRWKMPKSRTSYSPTPLYKHQQEIKKSFRKNVFIDNRIDKKSASKDELEKAAVEKFAIAARRKVCAHSSMVLRVFPCKEIPWGIPLKSILVFTSFSR